MRDNTDEEKDARIALLQSEVAKLEREVAMKEEREKRIIQRFNEMKEESSETVAEYLFRKEEDLSLDELLELYAELKRAQQEVRKETADRLSLESTGPSVPPSQQPPSFVQRQVKEEKP